MFPSHGTPATILCKYVLVIICVGILVQIQTAECENSITFHDSVGHSLYDSIKNTESGFPAQNSIGTTSPIEPAIIENGFPIQNSTEIETPNENTTEAGYSTPNTTAAVPPIERNPAFDDLDEESLHLYSRLIDIFNESRKLPEELNRTITRETDKSKAVLFLGKAGSGKTTLAQILAGNISRLQAKELTEDSGHYYIDDGFKINHGFESDTVWPYLIQDNETGVIFSDNPGFYDGARAYKDIEIASNIKTVAESFKYVKIALVCSHSSLRIGTYRSELTNFLERIVDFVKGSETYLSGITLIATKVENIYSIKNGEFVLVPDSAELQAIANFLNEVKLSYSTKSSDSSTRDDRDRSRLIVKILQNLLAKRSAREYKRIKILRKPQEAGPLVNQSLIMKGRESIRNMLLVDEGFEPVVKDSFGVAILATTRDSIDTLFRKLDSYIISCTEEFGRFLKDNFLSGYNDNDDDIGSVIARRKNDLDIIQSLKSQIEKCRNPEDFVSVVSTHIESNNLTYDKIKLENILTRYEILKNVRYYSTKNYLSSNNWQNALHIAEKTIENEFLYQSMLHDTFLRLKEYKIDKKKSPIFENYTVESNPDFQIDPKNVIIELNLPRYASLEFNSEKVKEFNQIVMNNYIKNQKIVRCEKNLLVIIEKFVFLSEILEELANCYFVDAIVLLAADTVIIDSDLNQDLEGRHLMIVAPQWVVQGRRRLVLDGKPHEEKPPKASLSQVGLDGKDGNPSGNFLGIGLHFKGIEDLTVQACGGNGQDGQDGGDGRDGKDGVDGAFIDVKRETLIHLPVIYNLEKSVVRKEGLLGSSGENSGAGGQGGKGGAKGSITIIDLASYGQPHSAYQGLGYTSNECEGQHGLTGADGKPGNSGSNGCSSIETSKTHEIFGFGIANTDTERLPCQKLTSKGKVLHERRVNLYIPSKRSPLPSACKMFGRLRLFIDENTSYNSKLTMRSIDEFQKVVKEKLCS